MYEKVKAVCEVVGFFIVLVSEMECFYKTINKEKKDWAYHIMDFEIINLSKAM